jgi:hypothetical protein
MATKQELIDKIQTIAKRIYAAKASKTALSLSPSDVDFDAEKFPILSKFSTLKQVIINLLTDQYELFISDVMWVAPRPTTFKILFSNDQYIYLIYTERSWIAQVEGKKYYLLNLSDEENAAQAISRILRYGKLKSDEVGDFADNGEEQFADEPTPMASSPTPDSETPEPPAEEPPTEEVPEELPT